VYPFAALPGYTYPSVPRVLLNKEPVENFDRPNDVFILGDCDESLMTLCQKLGWDKELSELHKKIGGFGADKDGKTDEGETSKPTVEDTVEQLTKELAEELKLDKDIEIRRVERKDESKDDALDSVTLDSTTIGMDKTEDEGKDPPTDQREKEPKEKL